MKQGDNTVVTTSIGNLGLHIIAETLCAIRYLPEDARPDRHVNGLAADVLKQINVYLKDPKWQFDIPYVLEGTPFQKQIWQKLTTIPYGKTCFYSDIARDLGTGPRAVGGACRNNPIPIIVPCHRVLAKSGIGGYDGDWGGGKVNIKSHLLRHEGVVGA